MLVPNTLKTILSKSLENADSYIKRLIYNPFPFGFYTVCRFTLQNRIELICVNMSLISTSLTVLFLNVSHSFFIETHFSVFMVLYFLGSPSTSLLTSLPSLRAHHLLALYVRESLPPLRAHHLLILFVREFPQVMPVSLLFVSAPSKA